MAKKLNILFATFSVQENNHRTAINGMIEPLTKFFIPKSRNFILLEQPHPGSSTVIPLLEIYKNFKLIKKSQFFISSFLLYPLLKLSNLSQTQISFKIRDFLSIFEFIFRYNQKIDLFIGLESINAIAGIILRQLGFINIVVYYVSDYSPNRYKPTWFNSLYLFLDRFAATHSDFIWDVSKAMMPARVKVGLNPNKAAPLIHVPNALFPQQINYLPIEKIIPNSLVFVGTLGKINGPDIAILALKEVINKIPSAKLHIFGDGEPDISRIKNLTERLKLKDKVIFHGFISDQVQLSNEVKKYAISLAPYLTTVGSPRWWADATKIRLYLAAGLPVITTVVPPLGQEVAQDNAGIITKDTAKDTANAILKLLKDKRLLKKMRENAINRARNNTWDNTYSQAIKKMGLELT